MKATGPSAKSMEQPGRPSVPRSGSDRRPQRARPHERMHARPSAAGSANASTAAFLLVEDVPAPGSEDGRGEPATLAEPSKRVGPSPRCACIPCAVQVQVQRNTARHRARKSTVHSALFIPLPLRWMVLYYCIGREPSGCSLQRAGHRIRELKPGE